MEATVQVYWTPKKGNTLEEYEDAFGCSVEDGRFAIADGATESSFAEIWSSVLTQKFVTDPPETFPPDQNDLQAWVGPLQKEWHANIGWDRLPWFAEEKARKGAFATFLGVQFIEEEEEDESMMDKLFFMFKKAKNTGPRWEALTIGDSNIYQIRGDLLYKSWPMETSEAFTHRPLLLSSNPKGNNGVWSSFKYFVGDYEEGDTFIMATDAIAKWFLERHEKREKPWRVLNSLKTDQDFQNLVADLRKSSKMQNDDTTLINLRWHD